MSSGQKQLILSSKTLAALKGSKEDEDEEKEGGSLTLLVTLSPVKSNFMADKQFPC